MPINLFEFTMKSNSIFWIVFAVNFVFGCDAELLTLGLGLGSVGALVGSYFSYCLFAECCDRKYVPMDETKLKADLNKYVFGQPMALEIVSIIEGHKKSIMKKTGSMKALAMSFQGWPGTGKNYVVSFMANALFKNGMKSKFVKQYVGKHDFPDPAKINHYKAKLQSEIHAIVKSCGLSLIIFDEVNDIPPGVLDVLKPMLDFYEQLDGIDYRQTIFVFLSNTKGQNIVDHLLKLNKPRADIKLSDFENILKTDVYNVEKGGFKESKVISSHLIDHFIPFLPMEQIHVEKCIRSEFELHGVFTPSKSQIQEAMALINFGPKNTPIFASSGCKRIKKQVAYILGRRRY